MSPRPTEQQWIVSDVVGTVAGIAAPRGRAARAVPVRVVPSTAPPGRDRSFTVTVAGRRAEPGGRGWLPLVTRHVRHRGAAAHAAGLDRRRIHNAWDGVTYVALEGLPAAAKEGRVEDGR